LAWAYAMNSRIDGIGTLVTELATKPAGQQDAA
jgi:hypothetical protein